MDTSYSVHGGRTTVTEVVRPSPIFDSHNLVVEASCIVHRCIRGARDRPVNSPRRLRVGSSTYSTDINNVCFKCCVSWCGVRWCDVMRLVFILINFSIYIFR